MRREIEGRPLLLACLSLLLGFSAKEMMILWVLPLLALLFAQRGRSLAIIAVFAGAGYAIFPQAPQDVLKKNRFFDGKLTITSIPYPRDDLQICEASDGVQRYQLRMEKEFSATLGDTIRTVGVIEPPSEIVADSFRANGWVGVLKPAPGRAEVVSRGWVVWRLATDWRNRFLDWSRRVLAGRSNVSVEALCFNVSSNLTPEYKENLQRTGTIHIISASGMHVMIVAVFLQFCLSLLPIPKAGRIVLLAGILLLYAAAAGLEPPVVRSAAMCILMMAAYSFRREGDLLSALAAVGLVYLLFDPGSIRQIGFQLSFLSVASLGLCAFPNTVEGRGISSYALKYINYTFLTSLLVSAATAPVVAYHFGLVSLIAPVANVAVAFVLGPIVVATLASSVTLGWAAPFSAGLLVVAAAPLAKWVEFSVNELARLPFAAVNVPGFSAVWLIPIYACLGIIWKGYARKG